MTGGGVQVKFCLVLRVVSFLDDLLVGEKAPILAHGRRFPEGRALLGLGELELSKELLEIRLGLHELRLQLRDENTLVGLGTACAHLSLLGRGHLLLEARQLCRDATQGAQLARRLLQQLRLCLQLLLELLLGSFRRQLERGARLLHLELLRRLLQLAGEPTHLRLCRLELARGGPAHRGAD
jgi:hypothetical protein